MLRSSGFIYQMRFSSAPMFIQTEDTPNPATLKFIPGREVMGVGAVADFPSADRRRKSPGFSSAAILFPSPSAMANGSISSPRCWAPSWSISPKGFP